jgi:transcriptional regulator with XRE-family HTH domain
MQIRYPHPMVNISIKFGDRVKKIRLKKGLSQAKLAKVLRVHPTYISGIERGIRNMTLKNIEKLAIALGVSIIELLK